MKPQILNISNKCTNNCYCCDYGKEQKAEKPIGDIKTQIAEFDTSKDVIIKGYEPSESELFFSTLNLLKQENFRKAVLITNGKRFADKQFCGNISPYKSIIKLVLFKMLGHEPEIHDSLTRTTGSFEQTLKGMFNLKEQGFNIGIIFTVLEQNFIYLEDVVKKFANMGIKNIIIEYPQNRGRCKENYEKIIVKFSEFNNLLIKVLNSVDFPIQISNIPLCMLGKHFDHSIDENGTLNQKEKLNKIAIEICNYCSKKEKCNLIEKEYLELFGEEEFYQKGELKEIIIELTSKCNLNCKFCFNKNYYTDNTANLLTMDKIKGIIDQIPNFVKNIRFTGGEPLLRKDLKDILEYAKRKGFEIWLNTNATLIDEENIKFIEEFIENILIQFNWNSEKNEINNLEQSIFEQKIKRIRKSKIPIVRLGTPLTKENIDNIEDMYEMVKSLEVDDWEFYREIPTAENKKPINGECMNSCIDKLWKLNLKNKKNYKIVNAFPFCCHSHPEKAAQVCNGSESDDGHIRFVIGTDLIARPSYFVNYKIGDLNKDRIIDCWNNKFMIEMRKISFAPQKCKKCKHLQRCKGGSRFVAKLVNNDYSADDYLADYKNMKNDTE